MSRPRSRAFTNSASAVTLSFSLVVQTKHCTLRPPANRLDGSPWKGLFIHEGLSCTLRYATIWLTVRVLRQAAFCSQAPCSSCYDLLEMKGLSRVGGCIILLYPIQPSAWATRLMGPRRCCVSGCEAWDDLSSAANHTLFLNFCEVCTTPLLCQCLVAAAACFAGGCRSSMRCLTGALFGTACRSSQMFVTPTGTSCDWTWPVSAHMRMLPSESICQNVLPRLRMEFVQCHEAICLSDGGQGVQFLKARTSCLCAPCMCAHAGRDCARSQNSASTACFPPPLGS